MVHFMSLKPECGLAGLDFDNHLRAVSELVDGLIGADRFDEVFKGKWYVEIFFASSFHVQPSLPNVRLPEKRRCG
jgi:hypothetical protein